MHEEWVHTRDNRRAVTLGQATTGRVITAAAAIMICVFLAFVFGGQRVIAEFGIGLAAAVFLDAFVCGQCWCPRDAPVRATPTGGCRLAGPVATAPLGGARRDEAAVEIAGGAGLAQVASAPAEAAQAPPV